MLMAVSSPVGLILVAPAFSVKTDKRQDGHNDDNKTDEIDYTAHSSTLR
jgi:hypothetical protein